MKSTYEAEGNNEMIKYGERNDKTRRRYIEGRAQFCGMRKEGEELVMRW